MGLYELLELDDELKELILDGGTTDEVQEMGLRKGLITMREDGWMKICLGLTTFEEVARETPEGRTLRWPPRGRAGRRGRRRRRARKLPESPSATAPPPRLRPRIPSGPRAHARRGPHVRPRRRSRKVRDAQAGGES
jgi:hypothetical protein